MTASDQSDSKKLKSRYASQLATLRELFADWSDDDLLFALQEVEGDLDLAIDRISEGILYISVDRRVVDTLVRV